MVWSPRGPTQPEFQPMGSVLWVLANEKPLLSPELCNGERLHTWRSCFFPLKATNKSDGGLNFVCKLLREEEGLLSLAAM